MRGRGRLIIALTVALMFLATGALESAGAKPSVKDWTVMVYLDADNNLDPWAYSSLSLMQAVGSTDKVNVIVLWDGYYAPAYLYKVVYEGMELVNNFPLNGLEVNMGDPATLETFVDFVERKFAAERYLLVLWNHGNDFSGSCYDEHPEDNLLHDELVGALQGHHIDILAYDACLEAMIEVAYEYNALGLQAEYLVACENYVPLYGYPYHEILEELNANPAMPTLEFTKIIVDEYVEFYKPRAHFNGGVMATLSVTDLSMIDETIQPLSALTSALQERMEAYHDIISEAKGEGNLPWAEYGWDHYIDMPTFIMSLENLAMDETIKELAANVKYALENAVVYVGNSKPMESTSAKGLGIWFPPSENNPSAQKYLPEYQNMKFASQGWLDFLYAYWNP